MEMFALEHDVAQWESALLPLRGAGRVPLLLLLSWHLRQRDGNRAIALSEEAHLLLPLADFDAAALEQARARLQLVQAEVAWLQGALDSAESLAMAACATCGAAVDAPASRFCTNCGTMLAA